MFSIQRDVAFGVTSKAAEKITELLKKQDGRFSALRVRVMSGGCAGLQYKLEFGDVPRKDDTVIETSGVKLYVDPKSGLFLNNSQVDWTEELMSVGFKITNPNAKGKCSCGESFTA